MRANSRFCSIARALALGPLVAAGCASKVSDSPAAGTAASGTARDGGSGSSGGRGNVGEAAGSPTAPSRAANGADSDAASDSLSLVASFNPAADELPTGLAVSADGHYAHVAYGSLGIVKAISLPSGEVTPFGTLPAPFPPQARANGLLRNGDGSVYVAVLSTDSSKYTAGIYKIPSAGGTARLFATSPALINPNKMAADPSGNLLFTDSTAGGVYKVGPTGGTAEKWAGGALLDGDTKNPCHRPSPAPFGAAGITRVGSYVFVSNPDKGSLIRLAIQPNGAAGTPEVFASSGPDCAPLRGLDGLDSEADGTIVGAANANEIVRISPSGKVDVLISGGKLDAPTDVAFATWDNQRYVLITGSAIPALRSTSDTQRPSLLSLGPLP